MRIGDLDKRIILQYQTKEPDGMGGWKNSWNDAYTVDAAIWDATSNERNVASSTTLIISHRIRIRYKSVLKASWRIKFGNRFFAIVGIVNPSESNRWLDIMAKESA